MHLEFVGLVLLVDTVDGTIQISHINVRVRDQSGATIQKRIGARPTVGDWRDQLGWRLLLLWWLLLLRQHD